MGRYIIRRLLWVALVLLIITFVVFLIFFVLPPFDPAIAAAGRQPTPALVAQIRHEFGLDVSMWVAYGRFVKHTFLGDENGWPGLGYSYYTQSPVRDEIFFRIPVTAQLAAGGAIAWLIIGIPTGILSGLKRGSITDRAVMLFALIGVSAPVFWLGLLFLYFFWYKLGIAAGSGYEPLSAGVGPWFSHMIMPWLVLSLLYAAIYARMVRGNLMETMTEDYIRTARAKGLSERTVVMKHGLRSALTPVVTIFGMDTATLFGGAIITETVFGLPGLGRYSIAAVRSGDLPSILGVTVFSSFFIVFMNLIVDVVYAYLDPRVRYT